jgi:3-phosphoshikimate 1-carboxyvinyltransferase
VTDPYPIRPFTRPARAAALVPGSKSITNRALLLGAMTSRPLTLRGALFSRDTQIMMDALRALGLRVDEDGSACAISVFGRSGSIPASNARIDVGNSGTASRFLTAFLNLKSGGSYSLDGDVEMRRRPISGLLDALAPQGASINFSGEKGHFPFSLHTRGLSGGCFEVDASKSSQIISALLMVAPKARSDTTITLHGETVHRPFIEMTTAMMEQFGVRVDTDGTEFRIPCAQNINFPEAEYQVEPDATAAGYFLALPAATGGEVSVPGLSSNLLQGDLAFCGILKATGLEIESDSTGLVSRRHGSNLNGVSADFTDISDTFLTLAALAPLLHSPTRITGIAHTRFQETDRVSAMAEQLRKLVGPENVREEEGSLEIRPDPDALAAAAESGVAIDTYEDHRIAMSFGILGCADVLGDGRPWLSVRNPSCCRKTFPRFFEVLDSLKQ